jgi:hypothetical protein
LPSVAEDVGDAGFVVGDEELSETLPLPVQPCSSRDMASGSFWRTNAQHI